MNIDGLDCKDNGRDIDLNITQNSKIELNNFNLIGAIYESIKVSEYRSLESEIRKVTGLDENEIKKIIEFANLMVKKEKPLDIVEKMYQSLKQNLISAPGQIAMGLLINWMSSGI